MSQYTHIFIRDNDNFVELGCYSRSNAIAQAFNGAPYEKIDSYSSVDLYNVAGEIKAHMELYKDNIADYRSQMALIPSFNNSVEDKTEALSQYTEMIREAEDELEELNFAYDVVTFLAHIADEYEMDVRYEHAKDQPRIYVGVECGSQVTVEDIIG